MEYHANTGLQDESSHQISHRRDKNSTNKYGADTFTFMLLNILYPGYDIYIFVQDKPNEVNLKNLGN